MEIDWAVWGPPLIIVAVGVVVAFAAVTRLKSEDEGVTEQGRLNDLESTRAEMLEQLKTLELDKGKLAPDEYSRERDALLARGSNALRALDVGEEATEGLATGPTLMPPAAVVAAASASPTTPQAAPFLAPEWKGALYAVVAIAVIGGLVWFAQDSSVYRRDGASMTGNQDLGGAPTPPGQPPPMSDSVKERVASLETQVASNPADIVSLNELTQLQLNHGDPGAAMKWNQAALGAVPSDPDALTYKAVLAAMVGQMDAAIAQLNEVLVAHPTHARALTYKGLMLMETGAFAEAVAVLEKAIESQPDNPILPRALAQAKQMAGMAPDPAAAGGAFAAGTVTLAPGATVTGSEIVFISVKAAGGAGGPPLAAKKMPATFPLSFSLTNADLMAMGGPPKPVPATFDITVRVDTDGNAMSRDAGAPWGTLQGVSKGASGLDLALSVEGSTVQATGGAATPAPAAAPAELIVKGTAYLGVDAATRITGRELVYISVRDPKGGPPLAAFKHPTAAFPVDFELTSAHKIAMGGDRPIPPTVQLSIRVDADGNAMTKEEGAPAVVTEVPAGSADLRLTLQ